MGLFKGLFKTGLLVAGVAGAVYAAENLLLRQLAGNPNPAPGWRPRTPDGELTSVTTTDDTQLRVVSQGEGRPVLLVHGLLVSLDAFAPVWDDLVNGGHRVIGMDLRGHGGSSVGSRGHDLAASGDDIATVIEELDLRNVTVVGHSMGGMAALSFATGHPGLVADRVSGLVLANTAAGALFDPPQNKAQLAAVKAGLGGALINHRVHGKVLARLYFGPRPSLGQVAALNELHASQPPETMMAASAALERYDVRSDLDRIVTPTLVIASDKDGILPPSYSRVISNGIPGARLEVLEGIGHMTHWEAPKTFVQLVSDFAG